MGEGAWPGQSLARLNRLRALLSVSRRGWIFALDFCPGPQARAEKRPCADQLEKLTNRRGNPRTRPCAPIFCMS
jgi:hypothetical protein